MFKLTPEDRAAMQADLDTTMATLDEVMAGCRYCVRSLKRGNRGCYVHRDLKALAYRTSPLSESYWTS